MISQMKTEKLIALRTQFELSTADEQIAVIESMPATDFDALLDLYVEAAEIAPEEDASEVWGRIEAAEQAAGLWYHLRTVDGGVTVDCGQYPTAAAAWVAAAAGRRQCSDDDWAATIFQIVAPGGDCKEVAATDLA